MDIEVAKRLVEQLSTSSAALDKFVEIVRVNVPPEERQPLIEGIGAIYDIQAHRIDVALERFCPGLNIKTSDKP